MRDVLGDILLRADAVGKGFSEYVYMTVGAQIAQLMHVLLTVYVSYYGLRLIMGTSTLTVSTVCGRILRMVVIVLLIGNWGYFHDVFYRLLDLPPQTLGAELLSVLHSGVKDTTAGLSKIWSGANQAAGAFAEQTGFTSVLPSLVGILIMTGAMLFIGLALSLLLLSKVATWFLVGLAPVFIACMLFERTRGIGWTWFEQLVVYALLPVFLYTVCAILISVIEPDLTNVIDIATSRRLTLTDVAGFILLCMAGTFVVAKVFTIVRGIASGLTVRIGEYTRFEIYAADHGAPIKSVSMDAQYSRFRELRRRFLYRSRPGGVSALSLRQGEIEAMQNKIRSHSLPL